MNWSVNMLRLWDYYHLETHNQLTQTLQKNTQRSLTVASIQWSDLTPHAPSLKYNGSPGSLETGSSSGLPPPASQVLGVRAAQCLDYAWRTASVRQVFLLEYREKEFFFFEGIRVFYSQTHVNKESHTDNCTHLLWPVPSQFKKAQQDENSQKHLI